MNYVFIYIFCYLLVSILLCPSATELEFVYTLDDLRVSLAKRLQSCV